MLRAALRLERKATGVVVALALMVFGASALAAGVVRADNTGTASKSGASSSKATKPTAKKPATTKTATRKTVRSRQPAVQTAPTPQRISEIQTALAKAGAYHGQTNGKWDAATTEALTQFQTAHGLQPTGKLSAPTLEKLGLGSETAGKAAPVPTSQSSSAPTVDLSN